MADSSATSGPGLIPVVDVPLHDLLSLGDISWVVQARQPNVAAMWASLSSGQLDQHSRILVFSDSLVDAEGDDELVQTARAVVAMANAGAHVFVASSDATRTSRLTDLIGQAATDQNVDAGSLKYHWLPLDRGGRDVLDVMRMVLEPEVSFPAEYPAAVDTALDGGTAEVEAGAGALPTVDLSALEPAPAPDEEIDAIR